MSGTAGILDMEADAGADWRLQLTWKDAAGDPIDLTGYTARMKVKTTYGGTLVATLTTENGGITLGGAAGTIDLFLDDADTGAITGGAAVSGQKVGKKYVYDLELDDGAGEVTRLVQGTFTIYDEVTD